VDARDMDMDAELDARSREILGYLNFSSGAADAKFVANVNALFGRLEAAGSPLPAWRQLGAVLLARLEELRGSLEAFCRSEQAEAVLRLVFDHLLPAYRRFHGDLLFHQSDEALFRPMFIARACEAVLQQGPPWEETDRIVEGSLGRLNDFIGYRPVAVLRSEQKIQPYAHEWVRPIPIYVRGAGAAVGRYRDLVERALAILDVTDSSLLFQAYFDPAMLDELAFDPRAYDFDQPAGKRPNYMFGQWDMNALDQSGFCRRFVLQQVTLDGMLDRIEEAPRRVDRDELLFEAAAVLAGTVLMGSGVSGNRPHAHASTVSLPSLVQQIAEYRDRFYEQLLGRMAGRHGERLRAEAAQLRQPFGGARQHLNQYLADRRARQLQHVHLVHVFAQMGYTEAAWRQVEAVPVASARMRCDMHCRMIAAHRKTRQRRLAEAADELPGIEDVLLRGIQCGAIVDPWNILGFGGQFSLFPAPESSIHDHRVDELIDLVRRIFDGHVRLMQEAAAAGDEATASAVRDRMRQLAAWWDKYASTEVGDVEGFSGREIQESAEHVAEALRAWHQAGTAAGDLAFWRGRVERFQSPKAYALVVDALIEQRDPIASMALLVQWLSQADRIPLLTDTYSFHDLATQWMEDLWRADREDGFAASGRAAGLSRWALARKFLDYLEANADEYWRVPEFQLGGEPAGRPPNRRREDRPGEGDLDVEGDEEADDLYGAAYEGITYRDSTDDGFDGTIFDGAESETDFELVAEAERIVRRLAFLATVARLWRLAAVASLREGPAEGDRDEGLAGWLRQARANRQGLLDLLSRIHRYRIAPPRGTHEAMVEYDRRRAVKETLLNQVIAACVETEDAARMIRAALAQPPPAGEPDGWQSPAVRVLHALLRGDRGRVRRLWSGLVRVLLDEPLLYIALEKGGSPRRVVAARSIHRVLAQLLEYLPRLGMLRETCGLIDAIQEMEFEHPVGPGATTEFDQVFTIGCRGIVRCLVASSEKEGRAGRPEPSEGSDLRLIDHLDQTVEVLLHSWLTHSQGVRLSVLETVADADRWGMLKGFIERYGADLFTQKFMNLGNLRAILHEGVPAWLESLDEEPEMQEIKLVRDLRAGLPLEDAARWLGVAIEAVVENYGEYVDYNTTTTQSDRGEMLYTLLDFLRLKAEYDRVAWNLRPVVLAHEVLVRSGRSGAADVWLRAVAERTEQRAAQHLRRLASLVRKHGMRLRSVADRLGERFVRPLRIDRLRALVRPAVEELREGRPTTTFPILEEEVAEFTEENAGAGFELPSWLEALEQEVAEIESPRPTDPDSLDPYLPIPQVRLSTAQVRREIRAMMGES
jgi:hypothetical protein